MNKNNYEQILSIVKIIKSKGVDFQTALTLVKNNLSLLTIPEEELEHRLFIIMNNTTIYAVLYVEENNYAWSIYRENSFGPFIRKNVDKNNHNYIIEMMLEAVKKFNQKKQSDFKKSLEEQVEEFNQIQQNEEGYHLK